jgi:tetratricopeptide (TPR) repeat protein
MAGNREVFDAAMSEADSRRWEGQWPEATRAYQRALAEFPDDLVACGGLGFCYMQTKQWAQALTQYEYVLGRDPNNVIALSKTAEIYAIQARRAEAFRAYLRLGELYLQQGQGARAEAAWQKAANLAPESPEPHERLAGHYRDRKDLAAAVSEYLAAAQACITRRDSGRARGYCEEALQLDPHSGPAQALLASLTPPSATAQRSGEAHLGVAGQTQEALAIPAMSTATLGVVMPPQAGQQARAAPIDQSGGPTAGAAGTPDKVGSNMGNVSMSNSHSGGTAVPPAGGREPGSGPARSRGRAEQGPPQRPLTAAQISGVLRQAQALQAQGHLADAINLCEQIFASGFDRPDARYFVGWLHQEAKQWDPAVAHFSRLLDDPDYALSCYYALGQCYAGKGDLRNAARHFDEAVDRVNLDALTIEEVDQLVQLCRETADTHRAIGAMEQGYNVLNALLGFLQSRGWHEHATQVEQLIRQYQQAPAPAAPTIAFSVPSTVTPAPAAEAAPTLAFPVPPAAPPAPAAEAAPPLASVPPAAAPTTPPAAEPAAPAEPAEPAFLDWLNSLPAAPTLAAAPQPAAEVDNSTSQPPEPADSSPALTTELPVSDAAHLSEPSAPPAGSIQTLDMMPDLLRKQVIQAMADIENYMAHGLLMAAAEECLRVVGLAPNYPNVHARLGEIYERQGKIGQAMSKYAMLIDLYRANDCPDEVIALYRHMLQIEPQNFSYRAQLIALLDALGQRDEAQRERTTVAMSYLQLGYIDRAISEFEQILAEQPTSVPLRMNFAVALMKAGRPVEAVAEYQRILQLDPANITALARWQIALAGGDNTAAALEVLDRLLHLLRGDGLRQWDLVAREYTVALDAAPSKALLSYGLGQIQQTAGNYEEAIQLYRQALREPTLEVLARFSIAQCYLAQGSVLAAQSAVQQLEQAAVAVRHVPVEPSVWLARPRNEDEEHQAPEVEIALLLAQAYRQTGQIEQMQALLQQVKRALPYRDELHDAGAETATQPGDATATLAGYQELVRQYRTSHQIDKAIVTLQEVTRLAPDELAAHAELGDIYINWGLLEEGLAELRTVATIQLRHGQNEEAAQVLQRIAAIYWDMGNREEALDTYRRVVELIPQDMQARMDVVRSCLQCGLRREAAEHQAVLAHHYFVTQQTKDAVASLQQLIAMDRSNYEAYDLLGQTYAMAGEYEQASRVYRNLMKVDPDNALAHQRLTELLELRNQSE